MNQKLLSIVLLSFQSESRLENTSKLIIDAMEKESIPFELLIIDDGSSDQSYPKAKEIAQKDQRITAYRLSRNYTSPYVQFAGIKLAKGACIVTVPDDLQRPLNVIIKMYRHWEAGAKLVVAYHDVRNDGYFNDFFSNSYYKMMNRFSDIEFPPGGADGFLADREVMDIINDEISPRNTTPLIEALRLGFEPEYFAYKRPPTVGKSRWTFKKKWRLASDSFFSSSNFPIKFIIGIGFTTALISFLIIVIIIGAKLFSNNRLFGLPIQGWATIVVLISFFNGLVLLCLGIVAEYIWRIYTEVKSRPGYIIRKNDEE
ncbi:glycosyltransferase [Portibacter lacus]|uniref:Glycosyl transferase family 2 n=1 Tax=Portibacter lacus TaxID=1099794 RepID=A0AA37SNL7_9BACT|nr:glycosyltransferase [Portibacter lacus]GLR15948.1 glycosyl transferase family 2 [Portibacter lacus]